MALSQSIFGVVREHVWVCVHLEARFEYVGGSNRYIMGTEWHFRPRIKIFSSWGHATVTNFICMGILITLRIAYIIERDMAKTRITL